jgi:hypothetical protein
VARAWNLHVSILKYCPFTCCYFVTAYLSVSSENKKCCSESDDMKCIRFWFKNHMLRERLQHSVWAPRQLSSVQLKERIMKSKYKSYFNCHAFTSGVYVLVDTCISMDSTGGRTVIYLSVGLLLETCYSITTRVVWSPQLVTTILPRALFVRPTSYYNITVRFAYPPNFTPWHSIFKYRTSRLTGRNKWQDTPYN